jgi:hypothetical protein
MNMILQNVCNLLACETGCVEDENIYEHLEQEKAQRVKVDALACKIRKREKEYLEQISQASFEAEGKGGFLAVGVFVMICFLDSESQIALVAGLLGMVAGIVLAKRDILIEQEKIRIEKTTLSKDKFLFDIKKLETERDEERKKLSALEQERVLLEGRENIRKEKLRLSISN